MYFYLNFEIVKHTIFRAFVLRFITTLRKPYAIHNIEPHKNYSGTSSLTLFFLKLSLHKLPPPLLKFYG